MDITPQDTTQQPISDDQELAKALAGVMPGVEPVVPAATPATEPAVASDEAVPTVPELEFEETPAPTASTEAISPSDTPSANGDLAAIKKDALLELRPLMDKVNLPAEEKFDTYLMLIRSTDDASLIGPAHDVAAQISDEKRRAEALLDIIKEIDYLSQNKPTNV